MSDTRKNIEDAFAGESKAHMLYHYFAMVARREGHEDLAREFDATAEQELKHAYCMLELLTGKITTRGCLELALYGEKEKLSLYPQYQLQAKEESLAAQNKVPNDKNHTAMLIRAEKCFGALSVVEARHHAKYQTALKNLNRPSK